MIKKKSELGINEVKNGKRKKKKYLRELHV
jgi:hypothetical protein